jgi:hypothetical protein
MLLFGFEKLDYFIFPIHEGYNFFYLLLPYIIYVMQSDHFSQCPAFIPQTAKEWYKKYSVKSP